MQDSIRPNTDKMIVNITHTVEQVLNIHTADIRQLTAVKVPDNEEHIIFVAETYADMHENLEVNVYFLENTTNGEEAYGIHFTVHAEDGLSEIADIRDDELLCIQGNYIVDVFTEHIHYICYHTKDDLSKILTRLNIPINPFDL